MVVQCGKCCVKSGCIFNVFIIYFLTIAHKVFVTKVCISTVVTGLELKSAHAHFPQSFIILYLLAVELLVVCFVVVIIVVV